MVNLVISISEAVYNNAISSMEMPEISAFVEEALKKKMQEAASGQPSKKSLKDHPAFGMWKGRNIDSIKYQQDIRAEWDE